MIVTKLFIFTLNLVGLYLISVVCGLERKRDIHDLMYRPWRLVAQLRTLPAPAVDGVTHISNAEATITQQDVRWMVIEKQSSTRCASVFQAAFSSFCLRCPFVFLSPFVCSVAGLDPNPRCRCP